MRKLNKFTFHEGTTDNPVVLSSTQIKTLVNMINDENFVYDFGGCVTSENGIFTKGEYNQLTFAGFNVIYTTLTPDEFSVEPVNPEINEGESTKLITNGVISKLVKFEISNVSVKDNIITNSEFKNKCSVDDNGVLHIAPAEENLDWEAEVNILAYPSYSSKAEGRSCTVKVKAIKITEIFFDSSVPEIVDKIIPTTLAIKTYPDNNTKTYTVVFSAINGIIDGSFYSSNNNIEDTITATANVLGNTLTVSKNIIIDDVILNDSIKNPVVFASLKQAFNLSDDVHEFKISDAKQTTDDQVNNFLSVLADNNNNGTNLVTLNELQYFNCTKIDLTTVKQFKDLTEIKFPNNLTEIIKFYYGTKVSHIDFNNCKNPVSIKEKDTWTKNRCFYDNLVPMTLDLSNVSGVVLTSGGGRANGCCFQNTEITDFIQGNCLMIYGDLNVVDGGTYINKSSIKLNLSKLNNLSGTKRVFSSKSTVTNVDFDEIKVIPIKAFSGLSKLITLNEYPKIPYYISVIKSYAFNECSNFNITSLPANLITLDIGAFRNCISIPYMDLSLCTLLYNSSNPFNANVFEGCTSMAYIKLPNIEIVIPATNISSLPTQTVVYVPDDLVDSYKAATNWNSIENKIKGYSEM